MRLRKRKSSNGVENLLAGWLKISEKGNIYEEQGKVKSFIRQAFLPWNDLLYLYDTDTLNSCLILWQNTNLWISLNIIRKMLSSKQKLWSKRWAKRYRHRVSMQFKWEGTKAKSCKLLEVVLQYNLCLKTWFWRFVWWDNLSIGKVMLSQGNFFRVHVRIINPQLFL